MGPKRPQQYYCRCGTRLAKDNTQSQCARCQRQSRDKLITPPEVPAEFWDTEQFEESFAARHMGRVSRAYRMHPYHYAVYGPSGISQTLLGHWLGLRQPQVSRFETGPPLQLLDTLQHWARVLRIPPELLWFRLPEDTTPPAVAEPGGSGLAVCRPTGLIVPAGAQGEWWAGCLGHERRAGRRRRARSRARGPVESPGYRRGGSPAQWWWRSGEAPSFPVADRADLDGSGASVADP